MEVKQKVNFEELDTYKRKALNSSVYKVIHILSTRLKEVREMQLKKHFFLENLKKNAGDNWKT